LKQDYATQQIPLSSLLSFFTSSRESLNLCYTSWLKRTYGLKENLQFLIFSLKMDHAQNDSAIYLLKLIKAQERIILE
jgi:hypothetical protein